MMLIIIADIARRFDALFVFARHIEILMSSDTLSMPYYSARLFDFTLPRH